MERIREFLAMGGYAAFVWPAFAVAAGVLVGLWLVSWRQLRANEAALEGLSGSAPRRRPRPPGKDAASGSPQRATSRAAP